MIRRQKKVIFLRKYERNIIFLDFFSHLFLPIQIELNVNKISRVNIKSYTRKKETLIPRNFFFRFYIARVANTHFRNRFYFVASFVFFATSTRRSRSRKKKNIWQLLRIGHLCHWDFRVCDFRAIYEFGT